MTTRITTLETDAGLLELSHPTIDEMSSLIKLLQSEDLDLRRLAYTSSQSYKSQGIDEIKTQWGALLNKMQKYLSKDIAAAIHKQAQGIMSNPNFPHMNQIIYDPFNLRLVDKESINSLQASQLNNILVLKHDNKIICTGRVLPVEGSWELVSLVTDPQYRRKGLATLLIDQILKTYPQRPLFSFQTPDLVPYYLKCYTSGNPEIPPYQEIPVALQRDLMYMNAFWGPNCIIKITGRS